MEQQLCSGSYDSIGQFYELLSFLATATRGFCTWDVQQLGWLDSCCSATVFGGRMP